RPAARDSVDRPLQLARRTDSRPLAPSRRQIDSASHSTALAAVLGARPPRPPPPSPPSRPPVPFSPLSPPSSPRHRSSASRRSAWPYHLGLLPLRPFRVAPGPRGGPKTLAWRCATDAASYRGFSWCST